MFTLRCTGRLLERLKAPGKMPLHAARALFGVKER